MTKKRSQRTAQTKRTSTKPGPQTLTEPDAGEEKSQTSRTSVQNLPQTAIFLASGMHCASCAIVIERKLGKLEGVRQVRVDSFTGKVELVGAPIPSFRMAY
jgi:Heavy-metal-associated domain